MQRGGSVRTEVSASGRMRLERGRATAWQELVRGGGREGGNGNSSKESLKRDTQNSTVRRVY